MARSMRQNVILSHGGKHGVSSRTLRKGQAPTVKDLKQIPDQVLGSVTELGVDAPASASAETQARMKARDAKLAQDPAPKPKKAPTPPPAPKAEEPEAPAEELGGDEAPADPEALKIPETKRELFLLRKADALTLADQLGVVYEEGATSNAVKELLADALGLS